jgi:hypothetical protein
MRPSPAPRRPRRARAACARRRRWSARGAGRPRASAPRAAAARSSRSRAPNLGAGRIVAFHHLQPTVHHISAKRLGRSFPETTMRPSPSRTAALADREPPDDLRPSSRSHCRSVLPLLHFIPDSLTLFAPLFLKRQCDREPPDDPGCPGVQPSGARLPGPLDVAGRLGINPILTLDNQLLNMRSNRV